MNREGLTWRIMADTICYNRDDERGAKSAYFYMETETAKREVYKERVKW